MNNVSFHDGADIIYVNAAQQSDDPLGRLMHDFHCTNADDMYYPELAERVRFYKTNDKGVTKMCEIMNEVLNEGRAEGREEMAASLALAMLQDGKPMEEIIKYSHLPESRIHELAKQLEQ